MLVNVFRQYEQKGGGASYPRSWPKNPWKDTKASAQVMHLYEALTQGFRYPAYLVAYAPTKGNRRLSSGILSYDKGLAFIGGSVEMTLFLVDVDGPSHTAAKSGSEVGIEAWWEDELPKIEALLEAHPGLFVYRSRNGYRIVGILPKPIHISSPAGADAWTRRYVSWCNYLSRVFGIRTHGKETPDKLGDWTRLQRVPHDSRDFATPDQLETIGDPAQVGEWAPKLAPEDMPPEGSHRKHERAANLDLSAGNMLLALVQGRGLRCEPSGGAEYDICCPRWQLHSPNEAGERDYEGKTRLYTGQGRLGGIKCFSDGCVAAHPTPGDWMDEFSWQEKLAARRALGKTTVGDPVPVTYEELRMAHVSVNALGVLLEGSDDSSAEKSPASCVHQFVCAMLRAGIVPEQVLYALTSEEFPLSAHVLKQTDPGWYVLEALHRATEALAEKAANLPSLPAPPPAALALASTETVSQQLETTACMFRATYAFAVRTRDVAFNDSDQVLANIAVACFGRRCCRRIAQQGDWLQWNGHRWIEGEIGDVRLLLGELCSALKADLKEIRSGLSGAGKKQLMTAFMARHPWLTEGSDDAAETLKLELTIQQSMVKKLESASGMNAVVSLIGDSLTIAVDKLDSNRDEVVFTNCLWNALTNETSAPRQDSYATRCVDMEWAEPPSEARDRWAAYLSSLGFDDETLGFLQRSFGYAALGRGTEKRFWWFRGETNVSKSTIINIVTQCLGTYVEYTTADLWLAKSGAQPGHTDDLAALRGARLVTADEFPKICRFHDNLMKRCTSGGGKLRVSSKGKTGFTYEARFSLVFASNFDPQISEDDVALLTRLTTFTFKVQIADKDKNPNFVAQFLAHPGQKLAVLEWVMQGARLYIANGLGAEPGQVQSSRSDYMQAQVSVEDQLSELLKPEPGSATNLTAVLERLSELQQRTRQRAPYTASQVAKAVQKLYNAKMTVLHGGKVFHGVRLRDSNLKYSHAEEPAWADSNEDYEQLQAPMP